MSDDLRRLTRAYRALCECGTAVARATDEPALLAALCHTLVGVGGYRMAWVGYPTAGGDQRVAVAASAGVDQGYLAHIHVSWDDGEHGAGPTGVAIRTGEVAVNRDSRTNGAFAPWRAQALAHGFGSSIALPLVADLGSAGATAGDAAGASRAVLGALSVYADAPDAFDDEERTLLTGMADALAHGIAALRARRTLEVREEQLRRAAKTEALGQLAGGLVHDVNNLLLLVSGAAGEIGAGLAEADPLQEHVADIQSSVTSAASLMRQVLAFGRHATSAPRRVVLSGTLDRLERLMRRALGKGVELELRCAPDLAATEVDATAIEEALVNLALNACDAMSGRGRVTLDLRNVARAPAHAFPLTVASRPLVQVTLRDSGAGMTPEVLGRVFEPFFTTKPAGQGTGLGLAMVLDVVRRHRGQVAVDSTPGVGTAVQLFFPVVA